MKNNGYNPAVENCYFCSGSNFKPHSRATYWKEFDLNFVECSDCGLIFANPMPNIETVREGNRALNIHHVSRGTLSQYRGGKEFSIFLRSIKPEGIMLDVGCAEGFFLLGIEENSALPDGKAGWKAEGVEIIESAVEFANKQLGLHVYPGTLDSLENLQEKYDFIRMNNVIEHVQDPVKFLQITNTLLKKGGRVYCSTPNGFQDGYVFKTANKHGIKVNLLENHFFYYHPKTLVKIFESCGFKVQKAYCEDISHSLNNFGLLPWFRYSRKTYNLSLSSFKDKTNEEFKISDEEIRSFKNDPSLKPGRLRFNSFKKKLFQIRFPAFLPLGHQQHIFAEKV
jgi:2-polyprenyl-3-methyl-5-hydroxy-6-metoxy-1,4-benzoquinol methylase